MLQSTSKFKKVFKCMILKIPTLLSIRKKPVGQLLPGLVKSGLHCLVRS